MNNSAMLRSIQLLKRKPMILLLLLPIQLVSALSLLAMPDMSKLLDFNNLIYHQEEMMNSMMLANLMSMLVSSIVSLVSLAGMFLLIPPAMELLNDGAAGEDTTQGWYMRGLRSHWWKPIVSSMIIGTISGIVFFALYIVCVIASSIALAPILQSLDGISRELSPIDAVNAVLPQLLGPLGIIIGLFVLVLLIVELFVTSLFGLFLPALTDRKFSDAFKVLFSRKGLRQLPRMLGGQIILAVVPSILMAALGVVYFAINGVPSQPYDMLIAILDFLRSWEFLLGVVLISIFPVINVAFQYCVYQKVRDAEKAV